MPGNLGFHGHCLSTTTEDRARGEPLPEFAAMLRAKYTDAQTSFVEAALLEESVQDVKFYVSTSPSSSSLFRPTRQIMDALAMNIRVQDTSTVRGTTLAELCQELGLQSIDVLKLDVQGSELRVLQGSGDYLRAIKHLILEVSFWPEYETAPLFCTVREWLTGNGFVLRNLFGRSATVTRGLISGRRLLLQPAFVIRVCYQLHIL